MLFVKNCELAASDEVVNQCQGFLVDEDPDKKYNTALLWSLLICIPFCCLCCWAGGLLFAGSKGEDGLVTVCSLGIPPAQELDDNLCVIGMGVYVEVFLSLVELILTAVSTFAVTLPVISKFMSLLEDPMAVGSLYCFDSSCDRDWCLSVNHFQAVEGECLQGCQDAALYHDELGQFKNVVIVNSILTFVELLYLLCALISPRNNPIHHVRPCILLVSLFLLAFEIAEITFASSALGLVDNVSSHSCFSESGIDELTDIDNNLNIAYNVDLVEIIITAVQMVLAVGFFVRDLKP